MHLNPLSPFSTFIHILVILIIISLRKETSTRTACWCRVLSKIMSHINMLSLSPFSDRDISVPRSYFLSIGFLHISFPPFRSFTSPFYFVHSVKAPPVFCLINQLEFFCVFYVYMFSVLYWFFFLKKGRNVEKKWWGYFIQFYCLESEQGRRIRYV